MSASRCCGVAVALLVLTSVTPADGRDAEAVAAGRKKPPPETIEQSGSILGIGIGSQMSEARSKLDPLRVPGEHEPDRKEQAGTRVYWKLNGTNFDWIIAWANKAGQVTRVRANPRPEHPIPFTAVGDPVRATVNEPNQAIWTVERPGGLSYRLVAQGLDGQAKTIFMFALGLEMR